MTLPSGATITEFAHGDRVVLVPKAYPDLTRPQNLESMARANHARFVWVREPAGLFAERWTHERMLAEHSQNTLLRAYYDDLIGVAAQVKPAVVLIMGDGGYWHPELLDRLKRFAPVAFWTGDDPEGSEITSRPFVRYYDYAFCGGIYFSRGVRIEEKFREWGAPAAKFIPLGACRDKYWPQDGRSDEEFFSRQRDIDVMYVGAAYKGKLRRVLLLKRHFKDRLFLAGKRWDGRGLGWKGVAVRLFTRLGGLGRISEITDDQLIALYQRSKIGFNCHLSYGPSNLRTYELPLNGVFQICDCADGLRELFELDREVVAYDRIDEAIEKIEYYLAHEDERAAIARAGYARAVRDYPMELSFARLFAAVDARIGSPQPA
ncbi:MAG TPA: glycosyltransferase [Vicinamibacterales bacterium]